MELQQTSVLMSPFDSQQTALHLTSIWRALGKSDEHYTVFIHLADSANRPITQHDGEPQGNEYPTTAWHPGETVVDKHDLLVEGRYVDDGLVLRSGHTRPDSPTASCSGQGPPWRPGPTSCGYRCRALSGNPS
ncbi:MAG: hypothetical protein HYX94_05310 [Chloroflexi bacterium]|nr:hypothetical protein [Chloroflexota bacterium]